MTAVTWSSTIAGREDHREVDRRRGRLAALEGDPRLHSGAAYCPEVVGQTRGLPCGPTEEAR
jgi:hypothetical protein